MSFKFNQWPPKLTTDQLQSLQLRATRYALAHGLLYLPPGAQPLVPTSAIHAPISLFPTPFPRNQFEKAKRLQNIYNVLYARIAMDTEFLDEVMGTEKGVGRVDEFVGQLWTGWRKLRDEGLAPSFHLGLFRSDYLLHMVGDDQPRLKQVEFNTISSSFGSLSQKVSQLHRHLLASTRFFGSSVHLKPENLPLNDTVSGLAEGLAAAHSAYNVPGSQILFVVQPGERNVFDQLWLEYELLEKYSIPVIRLTLSELSSCATVSGINDPLFITSTTPSSSQSPTQIEISTIYFRASYTPTDFPTPSHLSTRFLLEKSKAIKCPSLPLQLAGSKKIQEALTNEGVVERFLSDYPKEEVDELRESWMRMWGLDMRSSSPSGDVPEGMKKALSNFFCLVLKPQREGGGNNIYKDSIPQFLQTLKTEEREAWIAMELIVPPEGVRGYLIRAGAGAGGEGELVQTEVVSELGIFGWALFGDGIADKGKVREKEVGWLVRTKGKDSNEGGVATGFSVLDSLVLVDL